MERLTQIDEAVLDGGQVRGGRRRQFGAEVAQERGEAGRRLADDAWNLGCVLVRNDNEPLPKRRPKRTNAFECGIFRVFCRGEFCAETSIMRSGGTDECVCGASAAT